MNLDHSQMEEALLAASNVATTMFQSIRNGVTSEELLDVAMLTVTSIYVAHLQLIACKHPAPTRQRSTIEPVMRKA